MLKTRLFVLLIILFCTFWCHRSCYAQKIPDNLIVLHDEKQNYIPHEFFISKVTDERADRSYVALLINKKDIMHSPIKANLKDGAAISIKNFVLRSLPQDTTLRPVLLSIKEFKITETSVQGARVEGHLTVVFSFALQKDYGSLHLVDYHGGIRYNRPDTQPADLAVILRSGIEDGLSYFNDWINQQAESNIRLAKQVKVKLTDYSEKPEGDTIYYSIKRPLTWGDFKERLRESHFEAEVFTSIGYTEHVAVTKGIIYLTLAIKVDLAKSDCWVRGGAHDDYVLNHEQRHFDIEKLAGEHFKKKILAMDLSVDNYDGPINVEYLETLREATAIQKQYDADTQHGQNKIAQERWNEKIDKELSSYGLNK